MVLLIGCTSSQPVDVAAHPRVRPNAIVEFTVRDRREQLDSVIVTLDSISGIPWHDPQRCCKRITYALSDISDPRIRTFASLSTIVSVVAGGFFAFVLLLAIELRGDYT